jgi:short-subunit dehydrogenase
MRQEATKNHSPFSFCRDRSVIAWLPRESPAIAGGGEASFRLAAYWTGVTVTALQPGPADTDFLHRAGMEMEDTDAGAKGKQESQPADLARQRHDALLAGKDHVDGASFMTKLRHPVANRVPGAARSRTSG